MGSRNQRENGLGERQTGRCAIYVWKNLGAQFFCWVSYQNTCYLMYTEWILESCSLISSLHFWQRHTQNQPKQLSPDGPMGLPESPARIRITRWIRWEEDSSERQSSESWDARGIARLAGIACMGIIEHGAKLAANRKPHFRWLGGYVPRRWMGKQVLLQFRLQLQSPAKALASCECPCLLSPFQVAFRQRWPGIQNISTCFFLYVWYIRLYIWNIFSVDPSEKSCGIALPPPKKGWFKCFTNLAFHPNLSNEKLRGLAIFSRPKKAQQGQAARCFETLQGPLLPHPVGVGDGFGGSKVSNSTIVE